MKTLWNCLSGGPAARIVVSGGKRDRARPIVERNSKQLPSRICWCSRRPRCRICLCRFLGKRERIVPSRISFSRQQSREVISGEPADSSVCVWDLHLQSFERAAWIKHVLREPDAPDF